MLHEEETVYRDWLFRKSKGKVVDAPVLGGPVADTHCHLDMLSHPGLALARCAYHDVRLAVTVVETSESPQRTYDELGAWMGEASELLVEWGSSASTPACYVVAGCHPQLSASYGEGIEALTRTCARNPLTVAVGEIGLDYYYDRAPHSVQIDVFRRQLALANEEGLPAVLHVRSSEASQDAHEDALRVLEEEGLPAKGALLHCFTSGFDTLRPFLDLGCWVAFGGALTFAKSDDIRLAAAQAPVERIVTETDSPFMAPVPLRGTNCEPADTIFTVEALARVRNVGPGEQPAFCQELYGNALRFYGIGEA